MLFMQATYEILNTPNATWWDSGELHRQLAAQRRYIDELEKQLEPNVVQEIRAHLDAQEAK